MTGISKYLTTGIPENILKSSMKPASYILDTKIKTQILTVGKEWVDN